MQSMETAHMEALQEVDKLEGRTDLEVSEAFEKIYDILENYNQESIERYFLEDHPDLFAKVLKYSRLDTLPLDVNADDFAEFTVRYSFFKCDTAPDDVATVQNGLLTIKAGGFSAIYLPPIHFGSLRELTVSFYFSIDSMGDVETEKRFGFKMGDMEVYFMPETDLTGIAQFRRVYYIRKGDDRPQQVSLGEVTFLEGDRRVGKGTKGLGVSFFAAAYASRAFKAKQNGKAYSAGSSEVRQLGGSFSPCPGELMRLVINAHQDHMSHFCLCKTTTEVPHFTLHLELNRCGFCYPSTRVTDYFGIFIVGEKCEKSFTLESISLLQHEEEPDSYQLQEVTKGETESS